MTITSTKPPEKPLLEARQEALAASLAISKKDKLRPRYSAILKCVHNAIKAKPNGKGLYTALEFKDSALEPLARIKLSIKGGVTLSPLFTTGLHYVVQLRVAPKDKDGQPQELKLDDELLACLVATVVEGTAANSDEDGEDLSTLTFASPYLKLALKFDDGGALAEAFELHEVLRCVITPAPAFIEEWDRQRIASQAKREEEVEAARKANRKPPHPDQAALPFEQGG
jgi:hypothetical protein